MDEPGSPLDQFLIETQATIDRVGFVVMGIMADAPFSYTVGFWESLEHPEILITGVQMELCHQFFWELHDQIRAGESFEPGKLYDEIVQDYKVKFQEVPFPRKPLNMARNLYGEDFLALQMIYPDVNGWFPGDEFYVDPGQRIADGQWD